MNHSSQSGLTLDDAVRYSHLLTESWEVDNELDWVDIVGNDNELSLLVLDERDDVVQTELDVLWLWGLLWSRSVLGSLSNLGQTLLLLGPGLWSVCVEQLEELSGSVLVQSVLELGKRGRNLQSLVENLLLSLQLNVLWPFDESRKVLLWLDVLSDTEVSSSLLDQRVLGGLLRSCLLGWEWGLGGFRRLEKVSIRVQDSEPRRPVTASSSRIHIAQTVSYNFVGLATFFR